MSVKDNYFGSIGMALSCSLFLEGALKRYKNFTCDVDEDMMSLIKEWNIILLSILKDDKYKAILGVAGSKLIKNICEYKGFVDKCVSGAPDVSLQSLHYSLRFQESVSFLKGKRNNDGGLKFCDLGCGLNPLGIIFQERYNLSSVYCVDVSSEITDLYALAANSLCGKSPEFVAWGNAKQLSCKDGLNTVISVGCLPHMNLGVQKQYLSDINRFFDNFFVEIKYKKQEDCINSNDAFSIKELQKLRLEIGAVDNIETAMIRNSMRYLFKFIHSKPNYKEFLVNRSRSLFLSR